MQNTNNIIALSTAAGAGAIAVIRLSGPSVIEIVDKFFFGKNLTKVEGHTVHYGKIRDESGEMIDECMATVFRAPRSYTREDSIEISCHGSSYIVRQIIALFLRNGVSHAKAGEFTMRAFLNGQLDLSQAEAVADLIASDSKMSHQLALQQMRGGFSEEIKELRKRLIKFASLLELELDFGEEDVEFADRSHLQKLVDEISEVIQKLINSFHLGNVLKNGVSTVIAGKPNAGKSTLLNAMLNEERAIVSKIAGTTRDTIEEALNIKGIQFRLIDTAGLRDSSDHIESIGVARAFEKIESAAILLYVFDILAMEPAELEKHLYLTLQNIKSKSKPKLLVVANKMDLNPYTKPEDYYIGHLVDESNFITTSAINQMNIEFLKEKLYTTVIEDPGLLDKTIVSNTRHLSALTDTSQSLKEVNAALANGTSSDLVALDIRRALHHLGLITGEISTDDLLDSIFRDFCIGK